ncbi:MAG TPA: glycosyltransferase [Solirubrobacteraceae bacterium]|nr:glycosyltransferase [Solirubrobacteraceae bacterium]
MPRHAAREEHSDTIAQLMARRRVRVLFLIDWLGEQGGAERFTLGLATNLPRDRIEPWVCLTHGASDGELETLHAANVPVVVLGRRSRWESHRLLGLLRLLRHEQFDVLHTHMFGSNLFGSVAGRLTRVPVLLAHEHTWSYEGRPVRAWLDGRVIGRLVTRFIAVSRADAERMVSYERVPAERVLVMPTAYVPGPTADGDIRAELGLDDTTPLVATAAVLRPQKAIDVLLEAFASVLQRVPAAHLVIAGEGVLRSDFTRDPMRQVLENRAHQLGIGQHVHFLGIRRDVDAILRRADAAALSSDFEGTPLFIFECMANHTPLVATAVGGVPDVIEDGVSGILVPPRAPEALADALSELLGDESRRSELTAAASERLTRFRIDSVASEFASLYEQLVSQAGRYSQSS